METSYIKGIYTADARRTKILVNKGKNSIETNAFLKNICTPKDLLFGCPIKFPLIKKPHFLPGKEIRNVPSGRLEAD